MKDKKGTSDGKRIRFCNPHYYKKCLKDGSLQRFLFLQHLVRLRWDELSPDERREFAKVSIDLMNEIANGFEEWALKSQTAALVAEVEFCFHVDL